MEKYQHIERLQAYAGVGILEGNVYIFPKIDGTSGRIAQEDGKLVFGSRGRILEDSDNQGFKATMLSFHAHKLQALFEKHDVVLYGEFLKPHTIRYYKDDSWNKFYIYDIWDNENSKWMNYDEYKVILDKYELDYIPLLYKINGKDFDTEKMNECLGNANFLLNEKDYGNGEGIVIKNYDYINASNRRVWAKIVQAEFKEKANHTGKVIKEVKNIDNETKFINEIFTESVIEKEIWKIINNEENNGIFKNQLIPIILKTVFTECLNETKEVDEGLDMKNITTIAYAKIKNVLNNSVLPKLMIK